MRNGYVMHAIVFGYSGAAPQSGPVNEPEKCMQRRIIERIPTYFGSDGICTLHVMAAFKAAIHLKEAFCACAPMAGRLKAGRDKFQNLIPIDSRTRRFAACRYGSVPIESKSPASTMSSFPENSGSE